jgi:mediator of replication checkpoint protein 1
MMDSYITMPAEQSKRATDASTKPRVGLLAGLRKTTAGSSASNSESEDDASESDRDVLAQKLRVDQIKSQPQPLESGSPAEEEEDSDNGAAYERMKKRLAASKAAEEAQRVGKAQDDTPVAASAASSDEEDDKPPCLASRQYTITAVFSWSIRHPERNASKVASSSISRI